MGRTDSGSLEHRPPIPRPRSGRFLVTVAALAVVGASCSSDFGVIPPESVVDTTSPARTTTTDGSPTTVTTTPPDTPTTTTATTPPGPLLGLAVEPVATGLAQPVFVTAPEGDTRLFVVERQGTVRIIDDNGDVLPEPFLDLRDRVGSTGIEQGLLGMAFHPDFDDNGRFFLYYTDRDDDSRLAEFAVSDDPDRAGPDSERTVLMVEQPDIRHNAGMVQFGPDGYLYVGLGDGGAGASRNAQNPDTLLGGILRLDVDAAEPYAVPPDNPFVAGGGAPEVWLFGLRNPWRFDIDAEDGLLYIGDVGQAVWEEIDVVPLDAGGLNFGWHLAEGRGCFGLEDCDPSDYVEPVVAYTHEDGCSVTGGYVYRGTAIPELDGHYFYSDWCAGWVRSFRYVDGTAIDRNDWSNDLGDIGQVNSFGVDGAGELYVATLDGTIGRIIPVR